MCVEQAGVYLKNLKTLDIVMPVNSRHTAREWQEIFSAQVPIPEYNPTVNLALNSQAGKTCITLF